jgi:hypothetical protein
MIISVVLDKISAATTVHVRPKAAKTKQYGVDMTIKPAEPQSICVKFTHHVTEHDQARLSVIYIAVIAHAAQHGFGGKSISHSAGLIRIVYKACKVTESSYHVRYVL